MEHYSVTSEHSIFCLRVKRFISVKAEGILRTLPEGLLQTDF